MQVGSPKALLPQQPLQHTLPHGVKPAWVLQTQVLLFAPLIGSAIEVGQMSDSQQGAVLAPQAPPRPTQGPNPNTVPVSSPRLGELIEVMTISSQFDASIVGAGETGSQMFWPSSQVSETGPGQTITVSAVKALPAETWRSKKAVVPGGAAGPGFELQPARLTWPVPPDAVAVIVAPLSEMVT